LHFDAGLIGTILNNGYGNGSLVFRGGVAKKRIWHLCADQEFHESMHQRLQKRARVKDGVERHGLLDFFLFISLSDLCFEISACSSCRIHYFVAVVPGVGGWTKEKVGGIKHTDSAAQRRLTIWQSPLERSHESFICR
jgi:hypothetical protein